MMIRLNKSSERERGGSSKKIAPIDENTFGKNSPISDEVKFEFVPHSMWDKYIAVCAGHIQLCICSGLLRQSHIELNSQFLVSFKSLLGTTRVKLTICHGTHGHDDRFIIFKNMYDKLIILFILHKKHIIHMKKGSSLLSV